MSGEENAEWQLADLVDAIAAEVDRAEDTLALKSYARKVSLAIKKIALDAEVTMRRASDGCVYFRTVEPGQSSDTMLKLDFAQVLESQLVGLRRPLEDTTSSAPLTTLPGITPEQIRALNAIAIYSVDDLLRYTQTTSMLAEVSRKTGIPETKLRAWRGMPFLLELKPPRGLPGSTLVLEGGNFGLVRPPDAVVMFHGKEATILQWSSTRLSVQVPEEVTGSGLVFLIMGARPTNVLMWEAVTMDLRVEDVLVTDPVAGEPFTVEAVLQNRGAGPTPAFSVQWFVDDEARAVQPHGVLQPGQRSSESATHLQLTAEPGPLTVRFLVDPDEVLTGVDRASLNFSRTFEVRPLRSLTVGDFRALPSLDPLLAGPPGPLSVFRLLFRGLGQPGETAGAMVPNLAESWTPPSAVESGSTRLYSVTVTMRSDARFHDGTPVTAEDVRFTYQRLRELESPWRSLAARIQDITAQGQKVTFLLQTPDALTPLLTAGIVPQAAYSANPTGFGQQPVGTGPFRAASFTGERLELQSFRSYFRGAPRVDRLTVVTVPDLDRLGERVEQQEFHAAVMPDDEAWYQRLRDLGEWRLTALKPSSLRCCTSRCPRCSKRNPSAPDATASAHLWYLQE